MENDINIELAREALDRGGVQFFIMGGIVVSFLVGSWSPFSGILMGCWVLIRGYQKTSAHGESAAAIFSGEYLHALDGDVFKNRARELGYEASRKEIENAIAKKLPLSKTAWEFSRSLKSTQTADRKFSNEVKNVNLVKDVTPTKVEQGGDVLRDMGRSNLFVLGLGGSGKGIVVSNLIRHLPSDVVVTVIDPKGEEREKGYWEGANHLGFSTMELTSGEIVEKLDSCLDAYQEITSAAERAGKRSLLIIDEMAVLGHVCKKNKYTRVGDIIVSITSLGDCLGRKIWLIGQSPYVSSMGFNLSQLSQLEWVVLLREGQNLGQWKSVNVPPIDQSKLHSLIMASPVKRAIAIKGKWLPMPTLPNHSQLNRDG